MRTARELREGTRNGKPQIDTDEHRFMTPEKRVISSTTDGLAPRPGFETGPAPAPIDPASGQHEAYWVLSQEERAKGFVRPVRRSYRHLSCGAVTTMGTALAETYARDPDYYGSTFCVRCRGHFPVGPSGEFVWDQATAGGKEEKVGT